MPLFTAAAAITSAIAAGGFIATPTAYALQEMRR